ncbi:MAG: transposase [Bacteroidales bacterium]|nr:transposase [Bacteroidales bacterium]
MKLRQKKIFINHKRTERLYREQGLQLKSRTRRKKVTAVERQPVELPENPGIIGAMDFVSDSVAHRRKLKILTVIDPVSNRSSLIHPAFFINGKEVANQLEIAKEEHGTPEYIQV